MQNACSLYREMQPFAKENEGVSLIQNVVSSTFTDAVDRIPRSRLNRLSVRRLGAVTEKNVDALRLRLRLKRSRWDYFLCKDSSLSLCPLAFGLPVLSLNLAC